MAPTARYQSVSASFIGSCCQIYIKIMNGRNQPRQSTDHVEEAVSCRYRLPHAASRTNHDAPFASVSDLSTPSILALAFRICCKFHFREQDMGATQLREQHIIIPGTSDINQTAKHIEAVSSADARHQSMFHPSPRNAFLSVETATSAPPRSPRSHVCHFCIESCVRLFLLDVRDSSELKKPTFGFGSLPHEYPIGAVP